MDNAAIAERYRRQAEARLEMAGLLYPAARPANSTTAATVASLEPTWVLCSGP